MELQEVLKLLEVMEQHGLDEIEVEQAGTRIRLKKAGLTPMAPPAPTAVAPAPAAPAAATAPAATPAAPKAEADADLVKITSPMVGTFYRAASPDAEPFVSPGTAVAVDQVLCIIEAMKVMNEIKSEIEGEIVSVLVENGESVEFGQPLFAVRKTK